MKNLKVLSVIFITAILIMTSFSNVFAATNNSSQEQKYGDNIEYINNGDPKTLTDSSYKEPKNRIFVTEESAKSFVDDGTIQPFYGESEKSTVKKTEYYTKTTTPSGQNAGGTRFSTGGGFYVNKSGGPQISFSIGTSWGPVSFGVSLGNASTNNIGGYYLRAPNRTNYFKAKIDRKIRYRHVLVDRYQYGVYKSSYWTTWKDVYSENVYAVIV